MNEWTSRDVAFEVFPRTPADQIDTLIDALADHFYGMPAWKRRFIEVVVSRCDRTVRVSGFPRWMPQGHARRVVVGIASRVGVAGSATYVIERTVL